MNTRHRSCHTMAALQGRAVRKQELETAPVHQRSGTRAPFEPGGVTAGASAECTCGVISEAARYRRIFQFYADIKAVSGFKGKTG